MKKQLYRLCLLAGLSLSLTACRAEQNAQPAPLSPPTGGAATAAMEDLAGRLDLPPGDIVLVSEKSVTWRDGSLGCPKKDTMYMQALVPGTLIVLAAGGAEFEYHSAEGKPPFLCETPDANAVVNGVD